MCFLQEIIYKFILYQFKSIQWKIKIYAYNLINHNKDCQYYFYHYFQSLRKVKIFLKQKIKNFIKKKKNLIIKKD